MSDRNACCADLQNLEITTVPRIFWRFTQVNMPPQPKLQDCSNRSAPLLNYHASIASAPSVRAKFSYIIDPFRELTPSLGVSHV
jgi:hypothetical protein